MEEKSKMTQHTEGKWTHNAADKSVNTFDIKSGSKIIATVTGAYDDDTEDRANVKLIAEAPETKRQRDMLLEAAEKVLSAYEADTPDMNGCEEPELELLRAAILSCKGETP